MAQATNPTAVPSLVVLPESEWNGIKDLLNEVKDTLQTKSEAEIKAMWLESTEARKMLGVSAKTWQDYRDKRIIPFSQFGRKIYVRRAAIEAFLENHCIKAKND
ncbi:MAG: helix-turn-helix domain-containing protein [Bacteroidaceae bacterium]|nr:helix-turn-helix domain-containing protein [Bacteroidaceae bacterium]